MMKVCKADLLRFAEEVREAARYAAVCAPLHGKDPSDLVAKVNLDDLVDRFWSDDDEDEMVEMSDTKV